ncbi:MAG TPA: hypothetical protein DHU33_04340 [Firmicutes bacterium]|nr:hypothetical protein [Bacillota bacterium]
MDRCFNGDLERKDLLKNINEEELYGFLSDNKVLEGEKYAAIYEDLLENEDWYKEYFKEKLLLNEKFDNKMMNYYVSLAVMDTIALTLMVITRKYGAMPGVVVVNVAGFITGKLIPDICANSNMEQLKKNLEEKSSEYYKNLILAQGLMAEEFDIKLKEVGNSELSRKLSLNKAIRKS